MHHSQENKGKPPRIAYTTPSPRMLNLRTMARQSPPPCEENMNLLQKQADEANAMTEEAKRTYLLPASMIIGFAVLLFVGIAFSSSSTIHKVSRLGSGYFNKNAEVPPLFQGSITTEEIEAFCKFESSDTTAADFASQPCARCYILASLDKIEYRENGRQDFAQCYWNRIIATGGVPSPKDYNLRAYDENNQRCEGWVVIWYEDLFTNTKLDDNDPQFGDDGWNYYMSWILNYYYDSFTMSCTMFTREHWANSSQVSMPVLAVSGGM